ncbi:uncharacterized protein LOC117181117 [Belonocnema kinseyi]|uniref:uncharacterized protein LOC117181117 n=1 Tax=Belonocnema kinseyi TaxID=2817044 RepID=UPI00143DFA90|nr:uncharacterized protein LOC117181117 [Belonocnema kinseyi]
MFALAAEEDVDDKENKCGHTIELLKVFKALPEKCISLILIAWLDGSPWIPENKSRICSKHFIGNEKSNDPRSPSYNPTIFPPAYKKLCVNSEQALNRYRRVLKRPNQQFSGVPSLKRRKIDTMLNHQSSVDISMPDHSRNIACENETESTNNVENSAPSKTKIDCGVQVDFISMDNVVNDIFMCNRYIFTTGTCDMLFSQILSLTNLLFAEFNIVRYWLEACPYAYRLIYNFVQMIYGKIVPVCKQNEICRLYLLDHAYLTYK